ncbi:hypothetical protein L596_021393 [Steinernema carpocapsae]|uniref:Uncharacterized protein n=1 Tax=Steinernema carpocapsae TaxID=34508 RepID=A0A4U5MIK9_STECR|nr:hypothetical protein L596_021393 [Steinernema carpocapsae]
MVAFSFDTGAQSLLTILKKCREQCSGPFPAPFFESEGLVFGRESLSFGELVRHELEMVFNKSPDCFSADLVFFGEFLHAPLRIPPNCMVFFGHHLPEI